MRFIILANAAYDHDYLFETPTLSLALSRIADMVGDPEAERYAPWTITSVDDNGVEVDMCTIYVPS